MKVLKTVFRERFSRIFLRIVKQKKWNITVLNNQGFAAVNLGSLRCHDDNGNENVNKAIRLISKTTTLHVHHAFLYISLPSLHDYNVKMPNFTSCRGREHKTTTHSFFFFSWILIKSFKIQLQNNLPTFDELNEMEYARWSLSQREFTF